MSKIINYIVSRITMKKIHCLFVDIVNNQPVFEYIDYYGKKFIAQSKLGYRMEIK